MTAFEKILFSIGVILTLIGSFLPWQSEGDFISYWVYGIQVFPSVQDNGGLIIAILTLILIAMILRSPDVVGKPFIWGLLISLILVIDSIFHITEVLINRANAVEVIGSPTIQFGLVIAGTLDR